MARHPRKRSPTALSTIPFLKFLAFSTRRSKQNPVSISQTDTQTSLTLIVSNSKHPESSPTPTGFEDVQAESMDSKSLASSARPPATRHFPSLHHSHESSKPYILESTLSLQIYPPYTNPSNGSPEDYVVVSEAHMRKRKMDKVVKILGESIPPQLVFPSMPMEILMLEFIPESHETSKVVREKPTSRRRRSSSVTSLSAPPKRSKTSRSLRPSTANSKLDRSPFSLRTANSPLSNFPLRTHTSVPNATLDRSISSSSTVETTKSTFGANEKPPSNQNEQEYISRSSVSSRAPRRRPSTTSRLEKQTSFTFGPSGSRQIENDGDPLGPNQSEMRAYLPDQDNSSAEDGTTRASLSDWEELGDSKADTMDTRQLSRRERLRYSFVTRRESEGGWSGEWNANDMQYVIDQLRRLK